MTRFLKLIRQQNGSWQALPTDSDLLDIDIPEKEDAPIDPAQLLKALEPLLCEDGGIRAPQSVKFASLMKKFSKKLVSRCIYCNILAATKSEVLDKLLDQGAWLTINVWLSDAKENNRYFLCELLKLCNLLPMTLERLKENNTPKIVKSLSKSEDEEVKILSATLVAKWMIIIKDENGPADKPSVAKKKKTKVAKENLEQKIKKERKSPTKKKLRSELPENNDVVIDGPRKLRTKRAPAIIETSDDDVIDISESPEGPLPADIQLLGDKNLSDSKALSDLPSAIPSSSLKKSDSAESEVKSPIFETKQRTKVTEAKKLAETKKGSLKPKTIIESKRRLSVETKTKTVVSNKQKVIEPKKTVLDAKKLSEIKQKVHPKPKVKAASNVKSKSELDTKSNQPSETKTKTILEAKQKVGFETKSFTNVDNSKTKGSKRTLPEKDISKAEEQDGKSKDESEPFSKKSKIDRPKTVKSYQAKFRLTGLEEEAPLPKKITKKTPTVDKNAAAIAAKNAFVKRLNSTHPERITEKKVKPEALMNVSDTLVAAGGIKLIPAKPRPAHILHESTSFIDALTAQPTLPIKRKKKPVSKSQSAQLSHTTPGATNNPPTCEQEPVTPPPESPPIKAPKLQFYKDTLELNPDESSDKKSDVKSPASPDESSDSASVQVKQDKVESDENSQELPNKEIDVNIADSEKIQIQTEQEEDEHLDSNLRKSILVYNKRRGKKKSVQWPEDEELKQIFYFELDETERENVHRTRIIGDLKSIEARREREAFEAAKRHFSDKMEETISWWTVPIYIDVPPSLVEPGLYSREKEIQHIRQQSTLQAIYFNRAMVPDSPQEPDLELVAPSEPKIIPLDEDNVVGSIVDYSGGTMPSPQTSLPEVLTSLMNIPNMKKCQQNPLDQLNDPNRPVRPSPASPASPYDPGEPVSQALTLNSQSGASANPQTLFSPPAMSEAEIHQSQQSAVPNVWASINTGGVPGNPFFPPGQVSRFPGNLAVIDQLQPLQMPMDQGGRPLDQILNPLFRGGGHLPPQLGGPILPPGGSMLQQGGLPLGQGGGAPIQGRGPLPPQGALMHQGDPMQQGIGGGGFMPPGGPMQQGNNRGGRPMFDGPMHQAGRNFMDSGPMHQDPMHGGRRLMDQEENRRHPDDYMNQDRRERMNQSGRHGGGVQMNDDYHRGRSGGRRPPRTLCRHFASGKCKYGYNCTFLHPGINGPPLS